jgi:O-antigen/teichoic acid export membrane protein
MRIDQIMLKNMADSTQVGIYVAAVRFSEVWYFFPLLVTQSVFPAIVNAKRNDPLQYRQRMQQLYDVMTFVSLGIAVTLTFSASLLMERLYGQSYSGSDKVLAVHIWAGVIVFFGTTRGKWIIAENLQKKALIVDITGAVLNVILNLILIPYYNALGAAIATLLSYACTILATSIAIKEFREPFVMYMKSFVHCVTLRTIRQLVAGKYFV